MLAAPTTTVEGVEALGVVPEVELAVIPLANSLVGARPSLVRQQPTMGEPSTGVAIAMVVKASTPPTTPLAPTLGPRYRPMLLKHPPPWPLKDMLPSLLQPGMLQLVPNLVLPQPALPWQLMQMPLVEPGMETYTASLLLLRGNYGLEVWP